MTWLRAKTKRIFAAGQIDVEICELQNVLHKRACKIQGMWQTRIKDPVVFNGMQTLDVSFCRWMHNIEEAEEKSHFSFQILSYLWYYSNLFMYSMWKHIYNIMFQNLTLVKIYFKRISTSIIFNMKLENLVKLFWEAFIKIWKLYASKKT